MDKKACGDRSNILSSGVASDGVTYLVVETEPLRKVSLTELALESLVS